MKIVFLGNFEVDYSSETHHKKSLEALGHEVVALQEKSTSSEVILDQAMEADMFVWVHTHNWETPGSMSMENVLKYLKRAAVPSVTYHLDLWLGLKREADLQTDPVYKHIEHFFTVDKKMADWFNENTDVKGHYLPAGVFADECYMKEPTGAINDVIFVGSKGYHTEWPYRPRLIQWLKTVYRDRFKHYGGDGLGVVRGDALNQLYANTKVVVGDSLCINFDYPYYWSDRLYETLGRGGFLIMPKIKGLEDEFVLGCDGATGCLDPSVTELVTYEFGNFDQLKMLIDYYIENEDEREEIRKRGFEKVANNYTYKHRWQTILDEVKRNG